jgi:hypothetical protein
MKTPPWLVACAALGGIVIAYQWAIYLGVLPSAVAQTIDVRPVADTFVHTALGTLATVLSVVGGFVIRYVMVRTGLENSALEKDLNERLDFIIHKGFDFARLTYENEMQKRGSGLTVVKLDNYMIKLVAEYVMPRVTGIMQSFGVSMATETGRRKVEEMILARAPQHFLLAAPQVGSVDGGVATTPAAARAEPERREAAARDPFSEPPSSGA